MNSEINSIVELLPKRVQADLRRYYNWLELNFESIAGQLPQEEKNKLNRTTFIKLCIYREIIKYPNKQLEIIEKTFQYLSIYNIETVRLRTGSIYKDDKSLKTLKEMIAQLRKILKENKATFVIDAKDLKQVASEIVKGGFILE